MAEGSDDLDTLSDLADPVRRRLYRFVAGQAEPVGKDEAAAAAGVSRSLAAYHLDRLERAGLIVATYARRSGRSGPGAGRPAKLYARAPAEVRVQVPPRDDELLARLLAAAIEAADSDATRDALMHVARDEGARLSDELGAGDADHLVRALARRGYAPVLDAGEIRLHNCPFHHLVDEHRELVCRLNLELLDAATSVPGSSYRAALEPRAGLCCVALRRTQGA